MFPSLNKARRAGQARKYASAGTHMLLVLTATS